MVRGELITVSNFWFIHDAKVGDALECLGRKRPDAAQLLAFRAAKPMLWTRSIVHPELRTYDDETVLCAAVVHAFQTRRSLKHLDNKKSEKHKRIFLITPQYFLLVDDKTKCVVRASPLAWMQVCYVQKRVQYQKGAVGSVLGLKNERDLLLLKFHASYGEADLLIGAAEDLRNKLYNGKTELTLSDAVDACAQAANLEDFSLKHLPSTDDILWYWHPTPDSAPVDHVSTTTVQRVAEHAASAIFNSTVDDDSLGELHLLRHLGNPESETQNKVDVAVGNEYEVVSSAAQTDPLISGGDACAVVGARRSGRLPIPQQKSSPRLAPMRRQSSEEDITVVEVGEQNCGSPDWGVARSPEERGHSAPGNFSHQPLRSASRGGWFSPNYQSGQNGIGANNDRQAQASYPRGPATPGEQRIVERYAAFTRATDPGEKAVAQRQMLELIAKEGLSKADVKDLLLGDGNNATF